MRRIGRITSDQDTYLGMFKKVADRMKVGVPQSMTVTELRIKIDAMDETVLPSKSKLLLRQALDLFSEARDGRLTSLQRDCGHARSIAGHEMVSDRLYLAISTWLEKYARKASLVPNMERKYLETTFGVDSYWKVSYAFMRVVNDVFHDRA